MHASDKCYQLALALNSMATQISYDDVQTAVGYIAQCANNVLAVRSFFIIYLIRIISRL
jgi:hypothetical protein